MMIYVQKYISQYMHVTISIDERVWREFKAECFRRGLKASSLTEDYMRGMLRTWGIKIEDEPRQKARKEGK